MRTIADRLGGWSERTLPLANVLLTPWAMFQGAADEVVERAKEEGDEDLLTQGGTALEVSSGEGYLNVMKADRARWLSSVVPRGSFGVHHVRRLSVS